MTKLQKEIKELSNADLVNRFETLTVSKVHEENSVRGLTKKTHYEWQLVHDELVRRLDAKNTITCKMDEITDSGNHVHDVLYRITTGDGFKVGTVYLFTEKTTIIGKAYAPEKEEDEIMDDLYDALSTYVSTCYPS